MWTSRVLTNIQILTNIQNLYNTGLKWAVQIEQCLVRPVWRSLHPGEQVGISRIGLENGSKSLDLYFRSDYQISHFTRYCSKFFFCCSRELWGSLCSSPRAWCCPVLLPCCLVDTDFTFFASFWVKIAAILQALGTLRLALLCQVFQHRTWIHKCVKERKEIFQWLVCIHFLMLGIK